jgi:hypothetical protein
MSNTITFQGFDESQEHLHDWEKNGYYDTYGLEGYDPEDDADEEDIL